MTIKNYPHPVLSAHSNDFIDTTIFDVEMSQVVKQLDYYFTYNFILNDTNLSSLLKNEKSKFVIKLECSSTRFRKIFSFNSDSGDFYLPSHDVDDEVILSTFIVSKSSLKNYHSENFNENYDDASFEIFAGDILAEGPQFSFQVNKLSDSLAKVPSIFTIIQKNDDSSVDFVFEKTQIIIRLKKTDFEQYKKLKTAHSQYHHLAALSSSILVLPALTIIIDRIKNEIDINAHDRIDYEQLMRDKEAEFTWMRIISSNLKKNGIDLFDTTDPSFEIAQMLLGDPISNGLMFFNELSTFETKEEENF